MKTKLTSLILANVMLVSCGSAGTAVETTDTESDAIPAPTFYDELGAPDFNGTPFTILCRTNVLDELYTDVETGEVVNDAVYARNRNVSEKLNIDLKVIDVAGDWANKDGFINYAASSILSGDDAFQLIAGYMHYMPTTIQDELYLDINTLPYINLDNKWWMNGFNDNVTINGKMYIAMGDICTTVLRYALCVYANTKLLEQYNYDKAELYDTVRSGKWTFDKMTEMAKNVSRDLNGDGVMDDNDIHGIGMHDIPIRSLTNAFAIDYTNRDSNGLPVLALYGERMVDAYDKVLAAYRSDYWLGVQNTKKFMSDKMLFFTDVLGATGTLREMESGFAVLPLPKYDEKQANYRTEAADTTSVLMVPTTVDNPNLVGAALEALNYESYQLVTPAYFEKAMQGKYARDTESQEMMALIRDSIYFDFGFVFAGCIGGGINSMMAHVTNDEAIATVWAANKTTIETNLAKLLKFFEKQ